MEKLLFFFSINYFFDQAWECLNKMRTERIQYFNKRLKAMQPPNPGISANYFLAF
jgi:hypothetical protein